MIAIGHITGRKTVAKQTLVSLYFEEKWHDYVLGNEEDIPSGYPDFGVFSFSKEDQFCNWVHPDKLSKG